MKQAQQDGVDQITCALLPAAIMKMKKGPANGKAFTDEDWNDEATLTESPYPYSKVCGTPHRCEAQ